MDVSSVTLCQNDVAATKNAVHIVSLILHVFMICGLVNIVEGAYSISHLICEKLRFFIWCLACGMRVKGACSFSMHDKMIKCCIEWKLEDLVVMECETHINIIYVFLPMELMPIASQLSFIQF